MGFNWFVALAGVLYVGGTMAELFNGNYKLAIVFACYALANFVLAKLS